MNHTQLIIFAPILLLVFVGIVSSSPDVFSASQSQVTIVQGTSTPGCEANDSCHSPYKVQVGAGDEVVWANKDSASHTITSGNPADGPDGAFDSDLIAAGGSFSHTFSQQGTFDYFCKIHPWAAGQVVVGQGGTIPPRPSGDITISTDLSLYTAGELVKIQIKLADGRAGANIALGVTDADGNDIVTRSVTTDTNGMGDLEFKLAIDAVPGVYKASASALIGGKELLGSTQFDVAHLVSKVSIISVEPTDQQGNSVSSFTNGKLGFVKIVLDVESKGTALVAVNLFDLELTSLGVGSIKTPMGVGTSEMVISFFIPDDAALGSADIYANVFSDWPSQGGTPLTEESSTSVSINS